MSHGLTHETRDNEIGHRFEKFLFQLHARENKQNYTILFSPARHNQYVAAANTKIWLLRVVSSLAQNKQRTE